MEDLEVRQVGEGVGLEGERLELFIRYFISRWPDEVDYRYTQEWARRFKQGIEYQASDKNGQALLKKLCPYCGG